MTREEIQELLSAANVILASARSRTKPGKLRVAIGDAQDYIYRARRALEAEKPLANLAWIGVVNDVNKTITDCLEIPPELRDTVTRRLGRLCAEMGESRRLPHE